VGRGSGGAGCGVWGWCGVRGCGEEIPCTDPAQSQKKKTPPDQPPGRDLGQSNRKRFSPTPHPCPSDEENTVPKEGTPPEKNSNRQCQDKEQPTINTHNSVPPEKKVRRIREENARRRRLRRSCGRQEGKEERGAGCRWCRSEVKRRCLENNRVRCSLSSQGGRG